MALAAIVAAVFAPVASHAQMADMPGMKTGGMTGDQGAYPMTRDASGTAWQPDSAPMESIHADVAGWSTMLHGWIAGVYDNQGGPRGATKTFEESMLMGWRSDRWAAARSR